MSSSFFQRSCLAAQAAALTVGFALVGVAHAAHPFITDDAGTQGTRHWQLEVNTDHDRSREGGVLNRSQAYNAALTYGVSDALDVGVNLPYFRVKTDGEAAMRGVGDATLQAKWRFHEDDAGWSVAVKPAITLPTGSESKGLGAGRSTATLSLLGQYQKDAWTWLVNGGLTHNDNQAGDRKSLWNVSTALLYAVGEQWTLGVDAGIGRNPDAASNKHLSYGLLGVQYRVSEGMDIDVGYRRTLHSGPVVHTWGAGLTFRW